jgi:monofunctional biosynthetic peptidoglycan transglycosylase
MAKRRRGRVARLVRGLALGVAAWVAITAATVIALRWIDPPTTAFIVRDRVLELFSGEPGYEYRREWRDWGEISRNAALAVVAAEDQRFPQHHGFDFAQIDKALEDRSRGRRVRGASTITQQVAKNLYLWPGQSWFRKALEAGITVLIELTWPKQRILEVYLNVAEFGRGTWGVQAASRRFFRKDAARLTRSEAALLAAVLPAPKRFRADAPSGYVRRRQAWIERQMASLGGTAYLSNLD